ncbi:hypothetical protein ASPZODRAFT_137409 [Penicilliopsis zonata CBS 506.65]|uniref:Cytochrome P450 monooxygenase n=1 Tax=Penicilliopsis zonata CBS 506.65 TaxID=1073090 RepID=A0A1L9S4X7_9EURO|nr:hypothetical protein ASPZODRAFT_137409 [Penicilliopsis zonata CBS 506.65]OJJ42217.1 hypothetical protein ASPZODRAFT_137409 [Penicilliopsis zonata CBS 506.65]
MILIIVLLYIIYKIASFIRFYIIGRRTGFPLILTPIFSQGILWMVLGPTLQPVFQKYLPEWIYRRLDIVTNGWDFRRKNQMHLQLGKAFVVVSPDECSLWVGDPALAAVVLARRKDFVQPAIVAQFLDFFGTNILTSNGEDWQRQRRIIAPNLNESVMEVVWQESCQQARSMLGYQIQHGETNKTLDGLRSVAINVLGQAGYGQNQAWSPDFSKSIASEASPASGSEAPSARMAYFRTISMVTEHFAEAALIPAWIKTLPFMPAQLRLLGRQMQRVPEYIQAILEGETGSDENKDQMKRHNFLDVLVEFADNKNTSDSNKKSLFLSKEEISGNLWIFTGAGFDTTANTMGYAVLLLAVYPQWQAWIQEELDDLVMDTSDWEYTTIFQHCPRLLAVMFETLRLYTPVAHVSRGVKSPQQLAAEKGTHLLLPPMNVYIVSQSLHMDASIWGPDVSEFNPARWIDQTTGQPVTPERGAFLPWSGGPRVCPGMKMSQVEFVATLATLFHGAKCEPVHTGVTVEDARHRLKKMMDDSAPKLTLQVKDPKMVNLRWTPRDRR